MRLSLVLLSDAQQLTARALERAARELPGLGKVEWQSTQKGVSTFSLGGLELVVALVPAPVPDGEADGATEHSLSGFQGNWTLPEHRAHLVVVQQGSLLRTLEQLSSYTRVVAAVVRATGAVGVYWPAAAATHHPEFVVNIAQSELPLPLWVGLSIAESKKRTELLSVGMAQLELPELLLRCDSVDPGTLEFFYELLGYAARRRKPLTSKDRIGRSESERLTVKSVPSPVKPSERVALVELPRRRAVRAKKKVSTKR